MTDRTNGTNRANQTNGANGAIVRNAVMVLALTQGLSTLMRWLAPNAIVVNDAAVFGWVDRPLGVALVIVIGLVVLVSLLRAGVSSPAAAWGLALILAGGLSNLIDRLIWGGVVDYLPFFDWSTFNLADVEILAGVGLLLLGQKKSPTRGE